MIQWQAYVYLKTDLLRVDVDSIKCSFDQFVPPHLMTDLVRKSLHAFCVVNVNILQTWFWKFSVLVLYFRRFNVILFMSCSCSFNCSLIYFFEITYFEQQQQWLCTSLIKYSYPLFTIRLPISTSPDLCFCVCAKLKKALLLWCTNQCLILG